MSFGGRWLSWLRGSDKGIINKIEKQAENLVKITSALVDFISNYEVLETDKRTSTIKEFEREGDKLTHELFIMISTTFVTPLDKEDISSLTSAIDEVLDCTDGTADRLLLFKIRPNTYMLEFAKTLLLASQEIYSAISKLKELKNSQSRIVDNCSKIKEYEHQADTIYRNAIAELFETNGNAIEIIKLKDIYENLEQSLDRCQDVADIIEDITLKYG